MSFKVTHKWRNTKDFNKFWRTYVAHPNHWSKHLHYNILAKDAAHKGVQEYEAPEAKPHQKSTYSKFYESTNYIDISMYLKI
jgi:hypothetical protein